MELNKIYNEDCLETMARMNDNFVDLTVTSPPYDNLRTYNDNIDETWGEHVWKPIIKELFRVTKNGGIVVWVVGDATIDGSETGTSFRQALYFMECGFKLHDTMIYAKNNPIPLTHNRYEQQFEYMFVLSKGKPKTFNPIMIKTDTFGSKNNWNYSKGNENKYATRKRKKITKTSLTKQRLNIWFYNVGLNDKTLHTAPFPEKLAYDHILSWSNEKDLIYDPFMGSGTTAKMAHLSKRNWIGSELSKEYCDIAEKRLDPYLRQKTLF
ncbi:MAG: site-specific DNA-methyltransferase [Bacteroidales bacterium]|jgi:site-specific DNA-methyltransferase (adenine-specific)|nr:site-specific DNA-methyltransferase [Bacteroidales bacterium]